MHSRLRSSSSRYHSRGTQACGQPKCKMCLHVNPVTTIRGPKSVFKINRSFTCESTNVVYAIVCSLCSDNTMMLYVGETCRTLAKRAEEHLRSARLGYDNQVGDHFQQPGHRIEHLTICGIWQNEGGESRRKFTEMHLAHLLGTFSPSGMNIRS